MSNFRKDQSSVNCQMRGFSVHKPKHFHKKKKADLAKSFAASEFKLLWKDISSRIKDVKSSFYQNTMDAVVRFVKNSSQSQTNEIPAAVIHMGVNMPDHSSIFQQLNELLKSKGNYSVLLDPKKCHNNSRVLQVISQELEKQFSSDGLNPMRKSGSIHNRENVKPIVFIIQDVEAFSIELIEEIILNSKIYIKKLPIVLIFGMSSKMVTLHTVLPQKVLCYLGIETFQPVAVADHLARIIHEVLMSPSQPFKLGPKVLRLLVDTVLYHDFSVTNLSHLLKFCLFEHIYSNKASILCCSASDVTEQFASLKKDDLLFLKQLPSVNSYLENNPEIAASLSNNTELKSFLGNHLHKLFQYQDHFMLSLRVFNLLVKDLPGCSFGKQFYEIYLLHLDKFFPTKGYSSVEKFLKFQSHKDLLDKFEACKSILSGSGFCSDLSKLIKESIQLMTDMKECDFKSQTQNYEQEHFSSRFELQERMRSAILSKRSKFDSIRSKIVDDLMSYFKNLHSPLLLPLHEALFFENAFSLKKHLMPAPRLLFSSALMNPSKYFQCHCCRNETAAVSLPDICILYNMYLECGRLINLHDWMENFKSVVGDRGKVRRRTFKKTEVEESFFAVRFLHCASELQMLGFTKNTKQKKDHVIRLVF